LPLVDRCKQHMTRNAVSTGQEAQQDLCI
jgi:hypothetical protein